jgi:hypothetical protein
MWYQPGNNNVSPNINMRRLRFVTLSLRQRVRLHELPHLAHDGSEDGVVQHVCGREESARLLIQLQPVLRVRPQCLSQAHEVTSTMLRFPRLQITRVHRSRKLPPPRAAVLIRREANLDQQTLDPRILQRQFHAPSDDVPYVLRAALPSTRQYAPAPAFVLRIHAVAKLIILFPGIFLPVYSS